MWTPRYFHFLGEALEAVPEERRRLGLMIVIAALGHCVAFFVLHVVYPPTITLVNPKIRVTLYAPAPASSLASSGSGTEAAVGSGSGSGAQAPLIAHLGFWSEIKDPSLIIFSPHFFDRESPSQLEVKPIWPGDTPGDAATMGLASDYQFLPDRLPPLPERAAQALASSSTAPQSTPFSYSVALFRPAVKRTVVQWSPDLAARLKKEEEWELPEVQVGLVAESGVTVLRLAIDAEGEVTHVLVDQSSGRSQVDSIGVERARSLHFMASPGAPLVWGRVTIFWQFQPPTAPAEAPSTPETPSP